MIDEKVYVARCLAQYGAHTKKRADNSLLVRVDGGLYDLFQGSGWKHASRFRIIKVKQTGVRSLIQVNGLSLSPALREVLLKECQ